MKNFIFVLFSLLFLFSCEKKETRKLPSTQSPTVREGGKVIILPETQSADFFKTQAVNDSNILAEFTAPAKVSATVLVSDEGAKQNVILFENSELAGNYSLLTQHQMNINQIQNISIKQKQIELERIKDLLTHGAATGQDLLNAQAALSMEQTNLANERSALIEHEVKLIANGFDPSMLKTAKMGTAYLICDIPESQIAKIAEQSQCQISFTAFPNEIFKGTIDHVADMVDNTTRMVKLRIVLNNTDSKLKAGMFAMAAFGLDEGKFISVHRNALITVQGKHYVFVETALRTFERREVKIGQQMANRIIIFEGLKNGEKIAVEGVMQLKGLSFGY